jgi:hypothetical protein
VDAALVEAVQFFLEDSEVGHDRFYFDWYGGEASSTRALAGEASAFYKGARFDAMRRLFELFRPSHPERLAEPYFQRDRPCSLLIDEIEAIWDAIDADDDWGPFEAKVAEIRAMGAAHGRVLSPP